MRFTIFICLVVILSISNTNAIIEKVGKKVIGKVASAITCPVTAALEKISGSVLHEVVEQFCKHSGELGKLAATGFGFVCCDASHKADKTNKYCDDLDKADMIFNMICCLANEKRDEAMQLAIGCFKVNCDKEKGQCCIKKWHEWLMQQEEVIKMIGEQAKGK